MLTKSMLVRISSQGPTQGPLSYLDADLALAGPDKLAKRSFVLSGHVYLSGPPLAQGIADQEIAPHMPLFLRNVVPK